MTALYHATCRSNVYYYKDLCLGNTHVSLPTTFLWSTLNFVKPAEVMLLEMDFNTMFFGMKRMLYVTVVWSNNIVQWHCPLCCRALRLVLWIHCEPYVVLVLLLVIAWSQEVSQWMCPFVLGRGVTCTIWIVWCDLYDAIQLTIDSYQMFYTWGE